MGLTLILISLAGFGPCLPLCLLTDLLFFLSELVWGIFKRRLSKKLASKDHAALQQMVFEDIVEEELRAYAGQPGFDGVRIANKALFSMSRVLQGVMV